VSTALKTCRTLFVCHTKMVNRGAGNSRRSKKILLGQGTLRFNPRWGLGMGMLSIPLEIEREKENIFIHCAVLAISTLSSCTSRILVVLYSKTVDVISRFFLNLSLLGLFSILILVVFTSYLVQHSTFVGTHNV
jgi:hypothetical protein